jgi:DNA excision repair protein ERCC-2
MLSLKRSLDARGPCALEMPTGTGKTVSLLSLILSWILARRGGMTDQQRRYENMDLPGEGNPANAGNFRLIYCCRTLGEIDKTVEELKEVWANIEYQMALDENSLLPTEGDQASTSTEPKAAKPQNSRSKILALSLSSRKRMCINENIDLTSKRTQVDSQCRDLTAPHVRAKHAPSTENTENRNYDGLCPYYEGYEERGKDMILSGIYTFDDLSEIGAQNRVCPYFLARRLLPLADVIVYSYQYLLNPRVSGEISQQMKSDCIVVFDEAHNIDNVCIEALSVRINRPVVQKAQGNIRKLNQDLQAMERRDAAKLQREYESLFRGLDEIARQASAAAVSNSTVPYDASMDRARVNPVLSPEIAKEAIPQQIRSAKSFLSILDEILGFLRGRMKMKQVMQEKPSSFLRAMLKSLNEAMLQNESKFGNASEAFIDKSGANWKQNQSLMTDPNNPNLLSVQTLQHCSRRLLSLMTTLEITESEKFAPIGMVCDLVSLAAAYSEQGFLVLMEPWDDRTPTISNPQMELACLDAQIAMKSVLDRFPRVILTSGTLSPISMLPRIVGLSPVVASSLPMSLARTSVCPLIVTRGDDQTPLSTKFQLRSQPDVVRNYANLLLQMAQVVPDGIVCFFPSYLYLEMVVSMWHEMGMLHKLVQHKLVFVETEDLLETQVALSNYRRACASGRGAVLLSVARGKVSEGVDFDHHYGRCVILFGIPFLYTESRVLKARLEFIRLHFNIPENDFLAFDAMRMASQCVGRVVRGKTDYGIMIFADKRFARSDKRNKMPPWISQFISPSQMNLTTQEAVAVSKQFLKLMAQPISRESQIGTSLWTISQISQQPTSDLSKYHSTSAPKSSALRNTIAASTAAAEVIAAEIRRAQQEAKAATQTASSSMDVDAPLTAPSSQYRQIDQQTLDELLADMDDS